MPGYQASRTAATWASQGRAQSFPADHHDDGSGIGRGHRHDEGDVIAVQSKIAPVAAELLLFSHPGGQLDQRHGERPESGDAAEQLRRFDVHPDQRLALVH